MRPGRAAEHSPRFECRSHGRVELYLYPTSGPHRACNGITLRFNFLLFWKRKPLELNEWVTCGVSSSSSELRSFCRNRIWGGGHDRSDWICSISEHLWTRHGILINVSGSSHLQGVPVVLPNQQHTLHMWTEFSKRREIFTSWCGWLVEKISMNSVASKGAGLTRCDNFVSHKARGTSCSVLTVKFSG